MADRLLSESMELAAILTIFGLVAGSFLGTIALRLPLRLPIIFDRSRCDACGAALRSWELVPIVSWMCQGGKCRTCRVPISPLYLLVELGAASVCLWSLAIVPSDLLIPSIALGWLLLTLAVMDWRYQVLSDLLVVLLLGLGYATVWLFWPEKLFDHVVGMFVGAGSLYGLNRLYRRVRHRDGLGFGDVKLAGAVGTWLGWQALPTVFVLASTAALLVLLVCQSLGTMIRWNTKLAFGSYICFGTWITWLYGPMVWG